MTQKILQVNGHLVIPVEEFEREVNAESAQPYLSVPGLLWKIGYANYETKEAGGIYLFKDLASLQAFVDGPIGSELSKAPIWTGVTVKALDILVDFSKVLRAPIGEKFELDPHTPRTFDQMAAEAFASVKVIKPAELKDWMGQGRKLLVIDVQDAADVLAAGTIPGAVNISLGSLTYKADHELPDEWRDPRLNDHALVIITTCGMGPLGALGGKLLQDMGYINVYVLEGGVQAWSEAGYLLAQPA